MIFLIVWLVLAIPSFLCILGILNADTYATGISNTKADIMQDYGFCLVFALGFGIFGPVGVVLAFCMASCGIHGFRLKPGPVKK